MNKHLRILKTFCNIEEEPYNVAEGTLSTILQPYNEGDLLSTLSIYN